MITAKFCIKHRCTNKCHGILSRSPGPKSAQPKRRSVSLPPGDPAVRQRIRARMVARRVSEWREQQLQETEKVEISQIEI